MAKEIYAYNDLNSNLPICVCGVFVPENKQVAISALGLPRKAFNKKRARAGALHSVSVRPMLTFPCQDVKAAYQLMRTYSKLLITAIEGDYDQVKETFKRYHGESESETKNTGMASKRRLLVSHKGSLISAEEPEVAVAVEATA